MLIIKKHLVPLYEGEAKKGFVHVAVVDENGYEDLINEVDKNDFFSNDADNWHEWSEFAGLAYERKTRKSHRDWWLIIPIQDKNKKVSINVIAHEALHVSRMILTSRGVIFDPNNDEPYAYLVGWVAGIAYKSIPKKYK